MASKFYLTYFLNGEMHIELMESVYLPLVIESVEKSLNILLERGCSDIHICDKTGMIIKRF